MIWVKYLLYVWCLNVSTAFGCKTWKWLKRLDEVNAEIGHWDWQKNSMLTSKLALIPLFHAASKILSHQWLFYWSKSECLFKSIGRQEKCSHSVESNSLKKNTCSSGCHCFPGGSMVKNPPIDAGDMGSIHGLGRSSGGGHGNPSGILAWQILLQRRICWAGHDRAHMQSDYTRVTCPQFTMDFRIHMFKAGLNKYIYLNMLCRCLFLSKPTLHNIVVQMWTPGTWLGPDYVPIGFKELSVFLKSCITGFSGSLAILLISHLSFPWRCSWAECGASCLSLLR